MIRPWNHSQRLTETDDGESGKPLDFNVLCISFLVNFVHEKLAVQKNYDDCSSRN